MAPYQASCGANGMGVVVGIGNAGSLRVVSEQQSAKHEGKRGKKHGGTPESACFCKQGMGFGGCQQAPRVRQRRWHGGEYYDRKAGMGQGLGQTGRPACRAQQCVHFRGVQKLCERVLPPLKRCSSCAAP